jgi:hypothetical protein
MLFSLSAKVAIAANGIAVKNASRKVDTGRSVKQTAAINAQSAGDWHTFCGSDCIGKKVPRLP